MVELNEKFPDHRFDGAKEVPSRTSDSSAPDGGLEVVARLGGINGVKLQRHIEDMRPEARVEYNDRPALVRLSEAATALQSKDEQIERLTRKVQDQVDAGYCDAQYLSSGPPYLCGWQARAEAAEQQVQKLTAENERLREALSHALDHYDRNICLHESVHRGGSIWTICDDCGRQWADDRGGFQPHVDPVEIAAARSALETQEGEHGL
jgi:ribosomal protein L37AE/L43A